jgi:23S rRNA (uracil1939-C5)-methyltransferase
MIPLTDEVETVAVLARGEVPPPRVLYEDGEVLVVDKASHEPTAPQGEYAGSLLARVRQIPGAATAVPVLRMDADASGIAVFARDPRNVPDWRHALEAEATRRVYIAAVRGVAPNKGVIARGLQDGGRLVSARTRYRRLAIASGHAVLRVIPDQGISHQVRRHLAAIGHPLLGDSRYGHEPTNRYFEEKHGLDRTFLHCIHLEIRHPTSGAPLTLDAPLAGDLRMVLERMGGAETLRFLDRKSASGASAR